MLLDLWESFDSPISIFPRQGQADERHNTQASVPPGFSDEKHQKVTVYSEMPTFCELTGDL